MSDGARGSTFSARFVRGGVGAPVAFGQGTGIGENDDRGAVVDGGGVGEVRLAEAWCRGEVHARTKGGRAERKRKRAVCGRRWVKVGGVLETWAEGGARHSKQGGRELDWGSWLIGDDGCERL